MVAERRRWRLDIVTHVAVELHRRLSLELVACQVGIVRGGDVVVGEGILQLLRVQLGLLVSRGTVVFIHEEPSIEGGRGDN